MPHVAEAIRQTKGQILMDGEEICDARFSKCCGGITEEFQYCWEDTPKTYLTAVRDIALGVEHTLPNLTNEEEAEKWIRFNPPAFCNTQDKKILSEVLNDYDQETVNFYRWKETLSQEKLQQLIADKLKMDLGAILDMKAVERGKSG
ncbi:hypothetical protein OBE_12830, partial [human gut metagenome]